MNKHIKHEPILLDREEAAAALRVSIRTIDKLVADNAIGHVRIGEGRGRVLFRRVDLEIYVSKHVHPPKPQTPYAI
jgi:excisionase family DNA binding protein